MQTYIHKNHTALFLLAAVSLLMFGSLFFASTAQAQSHDSYIRTYSSDDGRSHIRVETYSASNSDMDIENRIEAYGDTTFDSMRTLYESSTYRTSLSGDEEVPPVDTETTGEAEFEFDSDEDTIAYELIVEDGEDITAAHLHCAPEGVNGPVTVGLFSSSAGTDVDGQLASGEITDGDITDNCSGINDIDDLIEEIEDGGIYVNVHSTEYPNGLIRGQLGDSDDEDDDEHEDDNDEEDDDFPSSNVINRIEQLLEDIEELTRMLGNFNF